MTEGHKLAPAEDAGLELGQGREGIETTLDPADFSKTAAHSIKLAVAGQR